MATRVWRTFTDARAFVRTLGLLDQSEWFAYCRGDVASHLGRRPADMRLLAFHVREHNSTIPHSIFDGRTPDEMNPPMRAHLPDVLSLTRQAVRRQRLEVHRTARRAACC